MDSSIIKDPLCRASDVQKGLNILRYMNYNPQYKPTENDKFLLNKLYVAYTNKELDINGLTFPQDLIHKFKEMNESNATELKKSEL